MCIPIHVQSYSSDRLRLVNICARWQFVQNMILYPVKRYDFSYSKWFIQCCCCTRALLIRQTRKKKHERTESQSSNSAEERQTVIDLLVYLRSFFFATTTGNIASVVRSIFETIYSQFSVVYWADITPWKREFVMSFFCCFSLLFQSKCQIYSFCCCDFQFIAAKCIVKYTKTKKEWIYAVPKIYFLTSLSVSICAFESSQFSCWIHVF